MAESQQLKPKMKKKKSPVLAAFLSIIPGFGALYNGNLVKALAQAIVFVLLIVQISQGEGDEAILGILIGVFYIYQIVDSFNEASRSLSREMPREMETEDIEEISLFWAVLVFGLGVVFQLSNLGLYSYRDIYRFWPVLLIAFGVRLVYGYLKKEELHEKK